MQIELKLQKSDHMIHETIHMDIVIDNNDNHDIQIYDPEFSPDGLSFLIKNSDIGTEKEYQLNTGNIEKNPRYEPSNLPPVMLTLNSGMSLKKEYNLMTWTGDLQAGNYSMTAHLKSENETFISNPVSFNITSANHMNSYLLPPVSGLISDWNTTFILKQPDGKIHLYLHGSILDFYAKSQGCLRVTEIDSMVTPILSTPMNTGMTQGNWIMWKDGSKLNYIYRDIYDDTQKNPVNRVDLGVDNFQLFAPLSMEMVMENPPGLGRAFLLEKTKGQKGNLIVVKLDPDPGKKAEIVKLADVPYSKTDWNRVTYHTNKDHGIHWITSKDKKISFHSFIYPEQGKSSLKLNQHHIKGDLLTTGSEIGDDDVLRGASLLWPDPSKGDQKPDVHYWKIDQKGNFEDDGVESIDWPVDKKLDRYIIRVSRAGEVHVLLRDETGQWNYFTRYESLKKINFISPVLETVELLLTSQGIPVIRYSTPTGFDYLYLSGKKYNQW